MPFPQLKLYNRTHQASQLWQQFSRTLDYGALGQHNPVTRLQAMEERTHVRQMRDGDKGWYHAPALDGYLTWLKAFQVLDQDLSPSQNAAIDHAAKILTHLRRDADYLLVPNPSAEGWQQYYEQKVRQLRDTGEAFLLSGYRGHFSISCIRARADGRYSYTLYDAGAEARIVDRNARDEYGNPCLIANVVEARIIPDWQCIPELIAAEAQKLQHKPDTEAYKQCYAFIAHVTRGEIVDSERDIAQRKSNCTTRAQRVLINHIMGDASVGERLKEFINSNEADEIARQLHQQSLNLLVGKSSKPPSISHISKPQGTWESHPSSLGPCRRYSIVYKCGENDPDTPEMIALTKDMDARSIKITWISKGGTSRAYVMSDDKKSTDNLEQYIKEKSGGERDSRSI